MMASIDPEEGNKEGPDFFSFYARGVAELLGGEDDFPPFAEDDSPSSPGKPGEAADKGADASGYDGKRGGSCSTSGALFVDAIAPGFSDTRRERLKSFLRLATFNLSREVDKMQEPVLKLHQLETHLRSRRQQPTCSATSSDGDVVERPHKKINIFSSSSSVSISEHESRDRLQPSENGSAGKNNESKFSQMDLVEKDKVCAIETRSAPCQRPQMSKSLHNNYRSKSEGATAPLLGSNGAAIKDDEDVNADMQFLLGSDHSRLDQILKKYSDEHSSELEHMGKQLEDLLNAVMSKFRPMTRREKIQLQKLIQNLPRDNLVRVVGILGRSDSSKTNLCDDITIDLEKEDNGTLWRLYYYVRAVEKARKLSAIQDARIDSNAKV